MLRTIKLNGLDDNIWAVSDSHFFHGKPFILGPRNYKTVEEHDNGIIHSWNQFVKPIDTVFFLGDFHLYSNKSIDSYNILNRLNFGQLYMLWGNHNASIKQLYQEEVAKQFDGFDDEVYPLQLYLKPNKLITFVGNYLEAHINNQHVIMSHYALRNWHKNGHGSWCWTGHSHGNDKDINPDATGGKILDFGIENFGRPINFREIKTIMDKKNILLHDHHGQE